MERLKRFPSLFLWFFFGGVALVYGVLITKDRFTPVYTLKDDRAASIINDNFRRAMFILMEDKGINEAAANGSTTKTVALNVAQTATDFGIIATPAWNADIRVTAKTVNSFTVTYTDPGVGGSTFDWILVR
jgi:hypothetical protein